MTLVYLPNEPSIANLEQQKRLTQLYLEPVAEELKELFLTLRYKIDLILIQ